MTLKKISGSNVILAQFYKSDADIKYFSDLFLVRHHNKKKCLKIIVPCISSLKRFSNINQNLLCYYLWQFLKKFWRTNFITTCCDILLHFAAISYRIILQVRVVRKIILLFVKIPVQLSKKMSIENMRNNKKRRYQDFVP